MSIPDIFINISLKILEALRIKFNLKQAIELIIIPKNISGRDKPIFTYLSVVINCNDNGFKINKSSVPLFTYSDILQ